MIPQDIQKSIDKLISKHLKSKVLTPALVDADTVLRLFSNDANELLIFNSTADADIFMSQQIVDNKLNFNKNDELIYIPINFYIKNRVLFNKFLNGKKIEDVYVDFIHNNCQKSNLNKNDSMSSFISLPIIINSMDSDPKKFMEIFTMLMASPDTLAPCFSCGLPCFIGDIKNLSNEQLIAAFMTVEQGASYCPNCVVKKFTSSIKVKAKLKGYAMRQELEALEKLPELKLISDVESAFKFMDPIKVKFNNIKKDNKLKPWLN